MALTSSIETATILELALLANGLMVYTLKQPSKAG